MAMTAPLREGRPERVGRKGVMTYVSNDDARDLKMAAVEQDTTMQDIVEGLITGYLADYKKQKAASVPHARISIKAVDAVKADKKAEKVKA